MRQKFLNFLGVAVCLVFFNQAFALEAPDLNYDGVPVRMMPLSCPPINPSVLAQKGRISKIPEFDVVLGCRNFLTSQCLCEIKYEILKPYEMPQTDLDFFKLKGQPLEILGEIFVQSELDYIRIRWLEITDAAHRGKKYGSQALETLLRDLTSRDARKTSSLILEVSSSDGKLIAWYKKFGFLVVGGDSQIVNMRIAPQERVKFPYWKEIKAQKKATEKRT